MKQKLFLKILFGIGAFAILQMLLTNVLVEPWIGRKIQTSINESNKDFRVEIGKVYFSIWRSGLELKNITISTKPEMKGVGDLKGEIASIKFKGISLAKTIFKKDYDISEVTIFNSTIKGQIPFPEKASSPKISNLNIRIDSLFFDKTNLDVKNTTTPQSFSVKDGVLKVYQLQVQKLDTLTIAMIKHFDFNAHELNTVSADSMYTHSATGINYSASSNKLTVDSFSIQPNYTESEFTNRHEFVTDRIEAGFRNISFHHFSAEDYLKAGNLVSSYVEIGKMNLYAFRDKRKKFKHVNKPTFQEMIYNYQGTIRVDSIGIIDGNIIYSEYAERAIEPGKISFQEINAQIYNITNDQIYKTEEAYLKLNAEALLMGKGKITMFLKGRIFDSQNTFSVIGNLPGMEVKELNPILEKNAFVYATSGKIDAMNFSFTANNSNAIGRMTLRYHDLHFSANGKGNEASSTIKENSISLLVNLKVMDSNPLPEKGVRVGVIHYERDPERFLFNYVAKSILTGIKSSLVKDSKKGKK